MKIAGRRGGMKKTRKFGALPRGFEQNALGAALASGDRGASTSVFGRSAATNLATTGLWQLVVESTFCARAVASAGSPQSDLGRSYH